MRKFTAIVLSLAIIGIIVFFGNSFSTRSVNAASLISVSVCQGGYSTSDIKTAVVVSKSGELSDITYQIVRASDNVQVGSGSMTKSTIEKWTRGETYYAIDFSNFKQLGNFKLKSNNSISYVFTIKSNIWADYLDEMVGFYRMQRCGTDTNQALPASGFTNRPSSEALHAACHIDDAKAVSESGTSKNMVGGWHDAGDNNKYGSNESWITGALAISYIRHPNANFDYDRNNVPDLLDEARYGAEDLIKILDATNAGVYDTIDAPNGKQYDWKYPSSETNGIAGDSDDRVGHSREAATMTFDATMKTAGGLAAVARAFSTQDLVFSKKCKTYAIKAYSWAMDNSDKRGGWYSIADQGNVRLWAEVQLALLTNEATYKNLVNNQIYNLNSIDKKGTNYWSLQPMALAEYYPEAGAYQAKVKELLKGQADFWKNSLIAPFAVTSEMYNPTYSSFGINEPNLSFAADAYRFYEITGDSSYRDAAKKAVQWTLGVNPWDISWVMGIGAKYPKHPHSRLDEDAQWNATSSIALPGFMLCGPNLHQPSKPSSPSPWYEDLPVKGTNDQWRFNEFSLSIQYGLLDLVVAMACDKSNSIIETTATPTPAPTPDVTNTPVITEKPIATPTLATSPTNPQDASDIKLQMSNGELTNTINAITPKFKLINTGNTSINLDNTKLRYYYTIDGEKNQTFYCDHASIDSSAGYMAMTTNVLGKFIKVEPSVVGADYYLELTFKAGTTALIPGAVLEIQARFAKSDWTNYNQMNDYSFNAKASSYVDWNKAVVYKDTKVIWGLVP